jgi:putative acetyltransferase
MVREETASDLDAISIVHKAAFRRDQEGDLVRRLRTDGLIVSSIVAHDECSIIGNAVFSKIVIRLAEGEIDAVALAPVAVRPEHQRQGYGSKMIETGLRLCSVRGHRSVFVLGDPAYYGRFGFSVTSAARLQSPYKGPHWMALELVHGALWNVNGLVEYPAAFADVD